MISPRLVAMSCALQLASQEDELIFVVVLHSVGKDRRRNNYMSRQYFFAPDFDFNFCEIRISSGLAVKKRKRLAAIATSRSRDWRLFSRQAV